jgi:hypothetical protein
MAEVEISGGCRCGAVRFSAKAVPMSSTVCYCQYCQHSFGAQSVAWVTFKSSEFSYTKGPPVSHESSPGVTRTFCGTCGTSLTYSNSERPDEIDVATATLDDPNAYPPEGIVFPSRKIAWDICLPKPIFHDGG